VYEILTAAEKAQSRDLKSNHISFISQPFPRAEIGTGQTSIQYTCWSTQISLVVFNAADERVEDSQWSISKYLARQQ
jgi:hypothetical protein